MAEISVGDIVFVRFPFSDLSQYKMRPALILADAQKGDLILCQITSRSYADINAIELGEDSFSSGGLIKGKCRVYFKKILILLVCILKIFLLKRN